MDGVPAAHGREGHHAPVQDHWRRARWPAVPAARRCWPSPTLTAQHCHKPPPSRWRRPTRTGTTLRLNLDPGLSDPFVPELPAPCPPTRPPRTTRDPADRLQAGDGEAAVGPRSWRRPCRCGKQSRPVPAQRRAPAADGEGGDARWTTACRPRVPVPAPAARRTAAHHQRRQRAPRHSVALDASGPAHAAHPGPPAAAPLPGPGGDREAARRSRHMREACCPRSARPRCCSTPPSFSWTGPWPPSRAWCSARCARSSSTAAAHCNGVPAPASSAPSHAGQRHPPDHRPDARHHQRQAGNAVSKAPYLSAGRTMIPLSFLPAAMDVTVQYDPPPATCGSPARTDAARRPEMKNPAPIGRGVFFEHRRRRVLAGGVCY